MKTNDKEVLALYEIIGQALLGQLGVTLTAVQAEILEPLHREGRALQAPDVIKALRFHMRYPRIQQTRALALVLLHYAPSLLPEEAKEVYRLALVGVRIFDLPGEESVFAGLIKALPAQDAVI